MVKENEHGAYLGAGLSLSAGLAQVKVTPNFDVFDGPGVRLVLGKCSRLADDEDWEAGRYGIDFHRALPTFDGHSDGVCDWGEGPIPVNALNYARYLPRTLKFREFTATLAFAARTRQEYQAKAAVYQDFYLHVYNSSARLIVAAPHAGNVLRPADAYHPYPHTEIDGWTARVAARLLARRVSASRRMLVSLHSTDYFGSLLDVGDFGLSPNEALPAVVEALNRRYGKAITPLLPAYRDHILPYTQARLEYFINRWGSLDPEPLRNLSTAVRFEVLNLTKIMGDCLPPEERYTLAGMLLGLERYWESPPPLITLNGIFSGRKTARLLNLAENLKRAGIETAVQVEVSRFLARRHPDLAAAMIADLLEGT